MKRTLGLFLVACALIASTSGCTKAAPTTNGGNGSQTSSDDHDHDQDTDHDHDHADSDHGHSHGGEPIELGTASIGEFSVRAARDGVDFAPGGDAPIDVWVEGDHASITAVRFWIGTEAATGSMKAKADIENSAQPNHWHTHALLPDPMPEGSRLWVEIETAAGKSTGSFDLHADHAH
jgi:ABC-type Zn2+ transport system substrate-binding protein/surface adhesin